MEQTFRAIAFWAASIVSGTFLLAAITTAVWAYIYVRAHPPSPGQEHMGSLAITYGTLVIVAGASFSSVFFGWRLERREVRRLRQRIADLGLKTTEIGPTR